MTQIGEMKDYEFKNEEDLPGSRKTAASGRKEFES